MLAAVGDEVGALAEGLPAHLTLVGLLTWGRANGRVGSGGSARPAASTLQTLILSIMSLLWPTLENSGK